MTLTKNQQQKTQESLEYKQHKFNNHDRVERTTGISPTVIFQAADGLAPQEAKTSIAVTFTKSTRNTPLPISMG